IHICKSGDFVSDTYLNLVNSGVTKKLAKTLGLPRPAPLRRTQSGNVDRPLVPGTVLLLGQGPATDALAEWLLTWDLDVRRAAPAHGKVGAVVVDLSNARSPEDVSERVLALGDVLRSLTPCARVITISRNAHQEDDPAAAATQQGITAFTRSVAKEMRAGSTANGIVLNRGVSTAAVSVGGALRFLLSARSAFVAGQLLEVSSDDGAAPQDWTRPLAGRVAVVTGAARGVGAGVARPRRRAGAAAGRVGVAGAGGGCGGRRRGARDRCRHRAHAAPGRRRGDRRGRACGRGGPGSGDERGGRQRPAGRYHRTRCGAEDPGPGPLPIRAAGRRRTQRRHHPGQTAGEYDPGEVGLGDRGEPGRPAADERAAADGCRGGNRARGAASGVPGLHLGYRRQPRADELLLHQGRCDRNEPGIRAADRCSWRDGQLGGSRVHRDRDDGGHADPDPSGGPATQLVAAGRAPGGCGRSDRLPALAAGRGYQR